jgi:hypothetical protein
MGAVVNFATNQLDHRDANQAKAKEQLEPMIKLSLHTFEGELQ